jgi:Na+/H+ antiporter NhaD/arsenite permease-like protein
MPIIALAMVFLLTAARQVGPIRLKIWQIMLSGAVLILVTGSISPRDAISSINPHVMLFLFGMFVVGEALIQSNYLLSLGQKVFKNARSTDSLILSILFFGGGISAILMNDTLAIIGTPLVLYFSKKHDISDKLLLLALCFSVTIGSVLSPIGNPQNLCTAPH